MAVGSLVLGILSLVFAVIPAIPFLGPILGIVGVILGVLGKKDPERKGMATAGMVMSIIGIVLGLIFYVACAACVGSSACAANDIMNQLGS